MVSGSDIGPNGCPANREDDPEDDPAGSTLRFDVFGGRLGGLLASRWKNVYPQNGFMGRMSSIDMSKEAPARTGILQGTLDMLILRTLLFGPAHGHQIAKHIQRTSDDFLQIEHGSLYPSLHRLERKGWVGAKWELATKDQKREFKYYRLTAAGKRQLAAEESKWNQMVAAIAQVMSPAEEG